MAEASVTEKELVDLRSVHLAHDKAHGTSRAIPAWIAVQGRRAVDDVRGTLVRMSQEVRSFHRMSRVL